MSMLTRGGSRLAALGTAGALAASALVLSAPAAQAAEIGGRMDGSMTWGLSDYLTTPAMGSITSLASGYAAPASYDGTTKLSTFEVESATIAPDGGAVIAFDGASLKYAPTGNRWLKFEDPIVDVGADGNGQLSALVSYGPGVGSYPTSSYDPAVAAYRGPTRTPLVDLVGNTSAAVDTGTYLSTWTGLAGTWAPELVTFLAGDAAAVPPVPGLSYRSQLTNDAGKAPKPLSITVERLPEVAVAVTKFDKNYLDLSISGAGFNPDSGVQPMSNGVYIGVAAAGGILGLGGGGAAEGMAQFAGSDHVAGGAIVDGAFTRGLAVETAKLTKGRAYSLYTWSAHGNPVAGDSQMTETPLAIDWNALTPPVTPAPTKVVPKLTVKVAKAPTTRKAGRAVITVKGSKGAATGKVKVQILKGKKVVKNLGAKALKNGKLTVTLPKRAKGTYKVKVTYAGSTAYKSASKTKAFKVRKR
ncbi:Ig-like domain repeat protein [Nocardioides sp. W7]|uniref:Ig-like domain repeat protein n=1 Tax=Nocardioides sp. W7 TaxID=2931390 RepID=UPI001FD0D851|nr:Ig-like domain repeat protein [Nocardioides sp. W7]